MFGSSIIHQISGRLLTGYIGADYLSFSLTLLTFMLVTLRDALNGAGAYSVVW